MAHFDCSVEVTDTKIVKETESVKLKLSESIEPGQEILLKLTFNGTMPDTMCGFYRSTYKDKDGNEKLKWQ